MAKTSLAKDELLASTGFIRAKYVAKLLLVHPKTVLRTDYERFKYGAVFYLNWADVLAKTSPHIKQQLHLPNSATTALEMVLSVSDMMKHIKVESSEEVPPGTIMVKAMTALDKAKSLLAKSVNSPHPPSAPAQLDIAPIVIEEVSEPEEVLKLPVKPVEVIVEDTSEKCKKCGHAIDPYHMIGGACQFGKGTVAMCTGCIG